MHLTKGSAWSTEKKYMRRYQGIEHRLKKEEMEEEFNKEAKEGWRFAASAARITEETTRDAEKRSQHGIGAEKSWDHEASMADSV